MLSAKVVNGRLDVADGELPEGCTVTLLIPERDEDRITLTEAQRAELAESIRQADQGETVDGWELLRELES